LRDPKQFFDISKTSLKKPEKRRPDKQSGGRGKNFASVVDAILCATHRSCVFVLVCCVLPVLIMNTYRDLCRKPWFTKNDPDFLTLKRRMSVLVDVPKDQTFIHGLCVADVSTPFSACDFFFDFSLILLSVYFFLSQFINGDF
jgi:hypothetical protein